jgi:hypothetical protein
LTVSDETRSVRGVTPEEAEQMLTEWAMISHERDYRVRAAVAVGVSKHRVSGLTGLGRSTIDRILTAHALSAQLWPSSGAR